MRRDLSERTMKTRKWSEFDAFIRVFQTLHAFVRVFMKIKKGRSI